MRGGVDLGVEALGVDRTRGVAVDLGEEVRGGVERVRGGVDLGVEVLGVDRTRGVAVDLGEEVRGGVERVRGGVDLGVEVLGVDRTRGVAVDLGEEVRGGVERVRGGVDLGVEVLGVDRTRGVAVDLGEEARGGVERVRGGVDLGVEVLGVDRTRGVAVDLGEEARGGVERVRGGVDLGVEVLGVDRTRGVGVDFGVEARGGVERVRGGVDLGVEVLGVDRTRGAGVRGVLTRFGCPPCRVDDRGELGAASRPRIASSTRRAGVGLRPRSLTGPLERGAATLDGGFASVLPPVSPATAGAEGAVAFTPPELTRTGADVPGLPVTTARSSGAVASVDTGPALRSRAVVPAALGAAGWIVPPEPVPLTTPDACEAGRVRTPPAVTPTRPGRLGLVMTRGTAATLGSVSLRLSTVTRDSFRSGWRLTKSVTSGRSLSTMPRRLARRICSTDSGFRQFLRSIPFVSVVMMPRSSLGWRRRRERP